MYRVAILGSGRGSNAEAILRAQEEGRLGPTHVLGIFSDQPHARILKLGPQFDTPSVYLDPGPYKTKFTPDAEAHWAHAIESVSPDLVVLAGFMRVLKAPLLKAFAGRIINLHPSLLPDFPGLNSIKAAHEAGVKETGCTVHWVNSEVDGGEIISQAKVPIYAEDSLADLEARVHMAEHALLPAVIRKLSEAAAFN
ncbi:phosphoribosylglycinamide formyltransferase [Cerasicoccus arenae]|uniref:Phosphoribosylglycinamide formyltransferase n=1 Tax=Cerasicoccus arenae TaxID=424488 RepID=A0A8J3GD70_9BACT|nr:phosphoribosylglycinamide formyltransferase [Cerasicoccus arenae]MBK1858804.1 phosphoribosylglycinamide formyltransferase [Cerasicoccus arenae]GHC04495.1 phosphoribosylglycinamide formyltransferase [Cerasicoccus arenae]